MLLANCCLSPIWVTRRLEKNCPIFQKVAQTVSNPKKAKISTTKLNLKAHNIYRSLVHYSTNFANAAGKLLLISNLGDKKIRKNCPIFQKVAQTVSNPKKAKISTTKLNLKAQYIYRSLVHYSTNFTNATCKLLLISSQGDQKIWKKNCQIFKK